MDYNIIMEKFMKALRKTIIALFCIATIGAAAFIAAINIYGNYDDYILPDGLEQSLKNADTGRTDNVYARIMNSNLLVHYESWGGTDARRRAKMFHSVLDHYKPDVVAVQEMSDQWYCCLTKNRGSYRLVYPLSSGIMVHMTGLMYNTDTVKLIDYGRVKYSQGDNGRLRRIVWGLFEDKKTKKRYIVTSTHFDLIREGKESEELNIMNVQTREHIDLVNTLQQQYNCPVYSCGDFNAMDGGGYNNPYLAPEIYDKIAEAVADVKYIAESKTQGTEKRADQPSVEHIFLSGGASVKRYSILSDTVMQEMSDHYPVFADVSD